MARKKYRKPTVLPTEVVKISSLRHHPRNYKTHPEEQLRHIAASIEQNGFYRNPVVARDGTILAGHGVVLACEKVLGLTEITVVWMDVDPSSPRAMKVLALDNELGRFAETDDRALTELLKAVRESDADGLLGTGYDDQMLSALAMVTRPASEIADTSEAAEWLGMPEYHDAVEGDLLSLVVTFTSEADRDEFIRQKEIKVAKKQSRTWSARWPSDGQEDAFSIGFRQTAETTPMTGSAKAPRARSGA